MQQERKPRLVRVNDFVADNLEAEADMMPPWTKFQAGIWRDVTRTYGHLRAPKWCESGKNQNRSQSLPLCVNERGPQQPADVAIAILSDGLSLHRSSLDPNHTKPNLLAQALRVFFASLFRLSLRFEWLG